MFTIDYVTITKSLNGEIPESILHSIGLNPLNFIPCRPRFGYSFGVRHSEVYVYYGGTFCGGTICLSAAGKGCRELESRFGCLQSKLSSLVSSGWHITRLDRNVDVFVNYIKLVQNSLANSRIATKVSSYNHICTRNSKNDITGQTLYIGSYKSDMFIRIYDKGAESGSYPGEIYRIEVVQKRNKISLNEDNFCSDVLRYFRPVVDSPDDNLSRRETDSYWSDIFGLLRIGQNVCNRKIEKVDNDYIFRIKRYVHKEVLKYGVAKFFKGTEVHSRLYNYFDNDVKFMPRDFCYK